GLESGGVWESAISAVASQLARTSIASAPQRRETSAQNSLSGRTLTVTSRITEKSRGFSRRRRTSVSPGLARNRVWRAAAQSGEPVPFTGTLMEIKDGRLTRATSRG